uniref:Acyltransferase 3 domain-containing protein n=1 Tax=Stomoxys calcitrans TaxID=35570 RepID=A0A1I8PGL9_STOCA
MTKEHSIWTALFPILHKHLSVAIVATIIFLFNMCKKRGFFTWPYFRLLARISYQVYLWHFPILFMIYGSINQPFNVSIQFLVALLVITYALSAIASFFIALMVEYPMAELLSVFDLKNKPKATKIS